MPICTGLDTLTVVPLPSAPLVPCPHVNNAPVVVMPAALRYPTLTLVHELVPMCTGLLLFTVVPSPKRPLVLSPQVYNPPVVVIPAMAILGPA